MVRQMGSRESGNRRDFVSARVLTSGWSKRGRSIQNTFIFCYVVFHRLGKKQLAPPPTTTILEFADRDEAGFAATLALQKWFQSRGFR
jgi:hypothetical protein